MWLKTVIVVFAIVSTTCALENDEEYDGYKKYTVEHTNSDIYKYMIDLQTSVTNLDFWLLTRNMSIVSVGPDMQPKFEDRLSSIGAQYFSAPLKTADETVNEDDECEGESCPLRRISRQAGGFFKHFNRYSTILNYMYALAQKYPHYVRFEAFGRSNEGRIIGGLSISLNGRREKKMAYIQGGTHGREWITTPTILYFATEICANIQSYRRILHDTELYLVPLLNPDGYEYSHTTDRFWRKNRHHFPGRSCVGVDINRNFGLYWNYRGSSQNHCSEVFSGLQPYSEPETTAVRRFLEKNRSRTKLVLDVHSFGKFLFYPYGYSKSAAPTKHLLHTVASRAATAIAKYRGTSYSIGSSSNILYEASGGLDDYAYGALGVPLSYTLELPGDNFQVQSSEIIHIARETFAGFVEFIRHVSLF